MTDLLKDKLDSKEIENIKDKFSKYNIYKEKKIFVKGIKIDLNTITCKEFLFYCYLNKMKYEEKKKFFYYFIDGFRFLMFTVYFGGISAVLNDAKYLYLLLNTGLVMTIFYLITTLILKGFVNNENERIAVINYAKSLIEKSI